jgi:iron(III) transport system ATP-binding protein
MPIVRLDNVTKNYGAIAALRGLSTKVSPGEALCLWGPSGCGKTTTLRLMAGLESPDAGTVAYDAEVDPRNAPDTAIGMMFQDFALWPHMRVARQIRFVLHGTPGTRAEYQVRLGALLKLFDLEDRRQAFPHELSGGEQQRLALVRTLAGAPRLLLLDEPFSNLDPAMRERVIDHLLEEKQNGTAIVFATHAEPEGERLADKKVQFSGRRVGEK